MKPGWNKTSCGVVQDEVDYVGGMAGQGGLKFSAEQFGLESKAVGVTGNWRK